MAATNFNRGDLVMHRAGGPAMAVLCRGDDKVTCQWFDQRDHLQTATLPADMLEAAGRGDDEDEE